MKKVFTYLVIFFSQLALAQVDYTYTTSKDYFNEAYEHLGKEEFSDAFSSFEKIDKSDTLYSLAQLSKLIAEYSGEYYKKVVKTGDKMINEESVFSSEAFYYKIKALIGLGEFNDVVKSIEDGSEKYPLYRFRYEYLRAKMFKEQRKYEDAKKTIAIYFNPAPTSFAFSFITCATHGRRGWGSSSDSWISNGDNFK